jgi:hypothetical protein
MKKLLQLFSLMILFISCNNQINKSSVTYEGDQINSLKNLITSFTAGDWDTYRSHFTEDANVVHNGWWDNKDASISIDEMLTQHIWNRENLFASLSVNDGIYEIITQENGNQFGHVWIEFTSKGYNSDEEIKIPVNLSFAMSGNKVNFEWGFYDTSKFPEPKVE